MAKALSDSTELPPRALCDLDIPAALQNWAQGQLSGRLTASAVLIALIERETGPTILLTRRSEHLRAHAAQVSFPGGRCDDDDTNCTFTALREAHEEVGLAPDDVRVIGYLNDYPTMTGFRITPVVGHVVKPPPVWRPAADEVAEVFELPLALALDPDAYVRKTLLHDSIKLPFYELHFQGHRIWGATAGMLYVMAHEVRARG